MDTIIVAVDTATAPMYEYVDLDNFIYNNKRIVTLTGEYELGAPPFKCADLAIISRLAVCNDEKYNLVPTLTVSNIRHPKNIQLAMYQEACNVEYFPTKYIDSRSLEKPVHVTTLTQQQYIELANRWSEVVIKPENGAMGERCVYINIKKLSFNDFNKVMTIFNSLFLHETDTITSLSEMGLLESGIIKLSNQCLIGSTLNEMIMVPYIDNIIAELRIVFTPEGGIYAAPRKRTAKEAHNFETAQCHVDKPDDYTIVSGNKLGRYVSSLKLNRYMDNLASIALADIRGAMKEDSFNFINDLNSAIVSLVNSLQNNDYGILFGSMDIYITSDLKWGMFEFSNEYGIRSMSHEFKKAFHQQVIIDLLKQQKMV